MNATGTARVRPGHRCVDEVRKRCHADFAGALNFMEGQMNRKVSDNPLEQACYWIDLAACLRVLNRQESLPHLLRCSEDARESPLGHYFAAETVCFLGFAGYLRQPQTQAGQSALRLLHRVVGTGDIEAVYNSIIKVLKPAPPG